MSIVQTIRAKFTRSQASKQATARAKYNAMIADLAAGVEHESESIQSVLDECDGTWDQLESDVANQGKRAKIKKVLAASESAKARLATVERNIEQWNAEIEAFCAPIRQKISAACDERRDLEAAVLQGIVAQRQLSETVTDTQLLSRESEVAAELKRYMHEESVLLDQLPKPDRKTHMLNEIKKRQATQSQMQTGFSDSTKDYIQRQIDDAQFALQGHDDRTAQIENALVEVRSNIAELRSEASEIAKAKLV